MRKFLNLIIIVSILIISFPANVDGITLSEYEKKLQGYIDEVNQNKANINKTQQEIDEANKQINNIKEEMKKLRQEVDKLNKEIVEYDEEIKIKSLQTKQIFEYFQMSTGENTYLDYIFDAETTTDLIYRMAIVEQMTEYNNKVTEDLKNMIEQNKKREVEIEKLNVTLTSNQKDLEDKVVSLGKEKTSLMSGSTAAEEQVKIYQEIVNGYKKQGCLSHHVIGVDCAVSGSAGTFRRPVKNGYLTSEYGYRWGSFHRGIDISNGNPYNTKIYPVANGTVIAKYYDNYGALVVVVEHYDAIKDMYYSSFYAHLDSFAPDIYVGKRVTTDNYLGYMGNSGYSTGPHLHLEIAPCRMYKDYACRNWNSYVSFMTSQYNKGFKGPRQLINFPKSLYTSWNTR